MISEQLETLACAFAVGVVMTIGFASWEVAKTWRVGEGRQAMVLADANKEAAKKAELPAAVEPDKLAVQLGVPSNAVRHETFQKEFRHGKEAGRAYLTVVGTDSERRAIEADWKASPQLAPFKVEFNFNGYKLGEWPVQEDLGFRCEGHPTIIVQDSTGALVARDVIYRGPTLLATALRRASPARSGVMVTILFASWEWWRAG